VLEEEQEGIKVKQEKRAEENKHWKKSRRSQKWSKRSGPRRAWEQEAEQEKKWCRRSGRKRISVGRRAGELKVMQEKRAEENKRWKKCRRVKSDAGEADGRE
jgi:hypothetical protein